MNNKGRIFDLPNIQNCVCQLSKYQLGHSSLNITVRLPDSKSVKLLRFTDVRYIQAPVTWIGAEFVEKSKSYSLEFAYSIGIGSISEGDYILYEAKINSRRSIFHNCLYQSIFDAFLRILSVHNMTHKNHIVRILAPYVTLEDET